MKRSRAKLTFAFGSLVAIAVAIFVLWPRGPALRVLDPRMRVMSARLLTGTNESFYAGNQLEGRARDFLKRLGLPVESLPDVGKQPEVFIGPTKTCRFAIYFKWTGAPDPTNLDGATMADSGSFYHSASAGGVQAVLVNESDSIVDFLPTTLAKFGPVKDRYLCVAELNPEIMKQGDFLLRFLNLPVTDGNSNSSNFDAPSNYLAEIVIKRIPLNQDRR